MFYRNYHIFLILASTVAMQGMLLAQSQDSQKSSDTSKDFTWSYSFSGDVGVVNKYVWRGQRLTDGFSLQPSATIGVGNFSISIWGTMDLEAVNEGDALPLKENLEAPPGDHSGLQGHFSEVDFTFSYALEAGPVSVDVGSIVYSFPNRSASLPNTVEVYAGLTLSDVLLDPSATVYVDVDETGRAGSTGLYFLLGGGHQFLLGLPNLPVLEASASLGIVNDGFSNFYYAASESGFHDLNLRLSLPVLLGERWALEAFVNYSALLGDFRNHQYQNPRSLYLGTAGSPATFADTVWGGANLNFSF
jgi:hypothetical protein